MLFANMLSSPTMTLFNSLASSRSSYARCIPSLSNSRRMARAIRRCSGGSRCSGADDDDEDDEDEDGEDDADPPSPLPSSAKTNRRKLRYMDASALRLPMYSLSIPNASDADRRHRGVDAAERRRRSAVGAAVVVVVVAAAVRGGGGVGEGGRESPSDRVALSNGVVREADEVGRAEEAG